MNIDTKINLYCAIMDHLLATKRHVDAYQFSLQYKVNASLAYLYMGYLATRFPPETKENLVLDRGFIAVLTGRSYRPVYPARTRSRARKLLKL